MSPITNNGLEYWIGKLLVSQSQMFYYRLLISSAIARNDLKVYQNNHFQESLYDSSQSPCLCPRWWSVRSGFNFGVMLYHNYDPGQLHFYPWIHQLVSKSQCERVHVSQTCFSHLNSAAHLCPPVSSETLKHHHWHHGSQRQPDRCPVQDGRHPAGGPASAKAGKRTSETEGESTRNPWGRIYTVQTM